MSDIENEQGELQPAKPVTSQGPRGGAVMALLVVLYGLALTLSVVLVFKGKYDLGVTGTLLVLTMAPVAFVLAAGTFGSGARRLESRIEDLGRVIRTLGDQSALSDDARRVLNRQSERELLCKAIEEDLHREDWDAAMVLIKELAERFGYRADAERFRKRVDEVRAATMDRELNDSVGYLDGLILQKRWEAAYADAARISRLYPYSPRVQGLTARVDAAYENHKAELERRFLIAAQEGHADEALSLLKELDKYLTPGEAEPLRELARGVIGKARDNLGAQFKIAVQDRRWKDAVRIGEEIIAGFPNTRMAAEVRNVIDGIRLRASQIA